jgi:hypothetical protein
MAGGNMSPALETLLITHDGRTQTLAAWARELGISPATFCGRLGKGWLASEVFQPYVSHAARGRSQNEPMTFTHPTTGVTKTLVAWAAEAGLDYALVYGRLRLGWDLARALATPVGGSAKVAA